MSAIELFHEWGSIQSFKVRMCLAELSLPWSSRRVDLSAFENLEAAYLAVNPRGLVPTLRWNGNVFDESSDINELLNDIADGAPLPTIEERARARSWTRYEDEVVHPAVRPPTFNLILKARVARLDRDYFAELMARHPLPARREAYLAAANAPFDRAAVLASIRTFRTVLERMETALAATSWLASDGFSLADVAMAAFVDRLDRLAMESLLAPLPRTADWAARIRTRPAFKTAQGPETARPDPLIDTGLVAALLAEALGHNTTTEMESL
ncbi:glutathione S-transferase family protein (plasmid) [Aminobacter sp. UC22_36]|uniref:glutathione S-transferase family protein n=1 Tax=Aminobacter sp. UC22_36 TaxID=3374549 RepID=UPI0037579993